MRNTFLWLDIGFTLIKFGDDTIHPTDFLYIHLGGDRNYIDELIFRTPEVSSPTILASLLSPKYPRLSIETLRSVCELYWEEQRAAATPYADASYLLQTLKDSGIEYGFISDITAPLWEGVQDVFGALVDVTSILSFRERYSKPSIQLFMKAHSIHRHYNRIMVGDDIDKDIVPANNLDWNTILLTDHMQDRRRYTKEDSLTTIPSQTRIMRNLEELINHINKGAQ